MNNSSSQSVCEYLVASLNHTNNNTVCLENSSNLLLGTAKYTIAPAQTLTGVLTIAANLVLLIVLIRFKSTHFNLTTRYFMVLEAVAHMQGGVTAIVRPYIPAWGCVVFGLSALFSGAMVISGMFLLALDSFIAVAYPYTFKKILTPLRGMFAISVIAVFWIVVMAAMLLTGGYAAPPHRKLCTVNDGNLHPAGLISFCAALLMIVVAVVVVQVSTMLILRKIARKVAVLQNPSPSTRPSTSGPLSSTKTISVIESVQMTQAVASTSGIASNKDRLAPESKEILLFALQVKQNQDCQPKTSSSSNIKATGTIPQINGKVARGLHSRTTLTTHEETGQHSNIPSVAIDICKLQVPHLAQKTNMRKPPPTRQERLMRLLTASISLTLVCWPQVMINTIVASIYDIYQVDRTRFDAIRVPFVALIIVDSLVYPILVLAMSSELRATAKKLFCRALPCK